MLPTTLTIIAALLFVIPLTITVWFILKKFLLQKKISRVKRIIIESLRGDGELMEPYLVTRVAQLNTGMTAQEAKSIIDELEDSGIIVSQEVRGDPLGPWKVYRLPEVVRLSSASAKA